MPKNPYGLPDDLNELFPRNTGDPITDTNNYVEFVYRPAKLSEKVRKIKITKSGNYFRIDDEIADVW